MDNQQHEELKEKQGKVALELIKQDERILEELKKPARAAWWHSFVEVLGLLVILGVFFYSPFPSRVAGSE